METLQNYWCSISSQVSSVPARGNFLSVPYTPVAAKVVKMPFSLKDPSMPYNQKSLQHVLKCSLLCLEREQLLSCAHQQQHTAISKWTASVLTETTGTNSDQKTWLPKRTRAQNTIPCQTLTKTRQQIIDHYLSFSYASFQNRRRLQPQCAAAQILPLLHVLLKREVSKGPIKTPFIKSMWVYTSHVGCGCTWRDLWTAR